MASNAEKLKIYDLTFKFTLYVTTVVANMNHKHKFTIGDRIIVALDKLEDQIIAANRERQPKVAAEIVYNAMTTLEQISGKLRRAVALNLISDKQKANCDMAIVDIRHQAANWSNYFIRKAGENGDTRKTSPESQE